MYCLQAWLVELPRRYGHITRALEYGLGPPQNGWNRSWPRSCRCEHATSQSYKLKKV